MTDLFNPSIGSMQAVSGNNMPPGWDEDRNDEFINDLKGGCSNCCGAPMYLDLGICSDCMEHCIDVSNEEL